MAAQRKYSAIRPDAAASTAITYLQIAVPATTAIDVIRMSADQGSSTTSAMQRWQINTTTGAGTVTSVTPGVMEMSGPASLCVGGATATGRDATIEPTGGVLVWESAANVLNGTLYLPVPEERITIAPSKQVSVKAPASPGGQNWRHEFNFIELV